MAEIISSNYKKILVAITCLLIFCFTANAQDLIVTTKGDSLNAHITELYKQKISFVYKDNGQLKYERNKRFGSIKSFDSKHYNHGEVSETEAREFIARHSKFRFGCDVGAALQSKESKTGLTINPQVAYFFSPLWGIGFDYEFGILKRSNYPYRFSSIKKNEDATTHYFILSIIGRDYSKSKKNAFLYSLGTGFATYRNNVEMEKVESLFTGNMFVVAANIGHDWGLSDYFALGIKGGLIVALSESYKQKSGKINTGDYLGRHTEEGPKHLFQLSLGLRLLK